jgi:Transglutaminase-like enzymes, putative cysteine proteases
VNPELNLYVPLARFADEVAGQARTPYGAVARLENWFVASGQFRYSNHPFVIKPALVGFVTTTREGYCQFFAGAMALMLRYLGIPARVAVGFAGGKTEGDHRVWLVSDRDAHAWVEVWFKGYGWLPFDPTPAVPGSSRRPSLAGTTVTAGVGGGGKGAPRRRPEPPAADRRRSRRSWRGRTASPGRTSIPGRRLPPSGPRAAAAATGRR